MYLQRRNRHLVKQEDAVIIAIHLLGKLLGFSSERAWHRFVTGNLFTDGHFLERSRFQVTDQGLPMGYVVTEASCHDRTAAETVMTQIPHPFNLGDKGFISSELQKKLYEAYQIAFWTPSRKNHRF